MKKRLLSMLVCAFILVPVFLTGCSDTDETLTVEQTKASAITLTLYSIVEDGTTETAVKAVQNALNDITENTLNTHVILKFYTASEYEKVLNDKINEIQADMDLQQRLKDAAEVARKAARTAGYSVASKTETTAAAGTGDETGAANVKADETQINEYGIADTVYPDEIDGQMDIFLINSAELYTDLIDKGVLSALEGELSGNSKKLNNYIYPSLLNSASVNGHTYAIPNNHMVGEYTFMLVNKAVASKYGYSASSLETAADLYDSGFISSVASGEGGGTVLMLNDPECTIDYATGEEGLLGTYVTVPMSTTITSYPPEIVFGIPTYQSILCMKNEYKDSIVYGEMNDYSDRTVATAFLSGSYADMQKYEDDYYVSVVKAPTYTMDDVCKSMYGVSAYSVDVSRSMEIISLLTTEPDVVNLLAYGVENVNYIKRDSSDFVELLSKEDSGENYYRMNPDYAGNQYKRSLTSDASEFEVSIAADNWAAAKSQNLASVLLPYSNFTIDITMEPEYVAVETSSDDDDEDETGDVTTNTPEITEPKVYMPVADMLAGLDELYAKCMNDINNYSGTDPDTGASMSMADYLEALTERLAENEYVSQALDVCNTASITNQYTTYIGG